MNTSSISSYIAVLILMIFFFASCNQTSNDKEISEHLEDGWHINSDGSFDFTYRKLHLNNCFPAMDDQDIRPYSFEFERNNDGGVISYDLGQGKLIIELSKEGQNLYVLSSTLSGFKEAPDWIMPMANALVTGADRFYKQGFGFAGASGIFPLPRPQERMERAVLKENVWSFDSYLFTGLFSPQDESFVLSAYDHRNYQHRSTIYNKQHRIGLIDRHKDTDLIFLETGFGTEKITLEDSMLKLPDIYIRTGKNPYQTFREQAKSMAEYNDVKLTFNPRYYYCSWYEYKSDYNSKILLEMLDKMKDIDPPVKIQTIQIDDGYAPRGDWLSFNRNFPEGMENIVQAINKENIEAGIWVGPFMVGENSFIFREHKEWLLKDKYGDLFDQGPDMYVLDTSHPEAFDYLRKVFRTLREIGFTTFKTDFLDWGIIDSDKVQRYTPGKTSVQYFMDVIQMIHKEIGEESYWLACISPFGQMIGYADGMRLSNDVWSWNNESAGNMFREMYAGQFFNNILWQNDPDVIYLRDYDTDFNKVQQYSLALYSGFMGGTITTSCRFHTLYNEMLNLWRFIQPSQKRFTANLPYWGEKNNMLVATRNYGENRAALFLNVSDSAVSSTFNLKNLTDLNKATAFSWGPDSFSPLGSLNEIKIDLRAYESRLIYFSPKGSTPPDYMNLTTEN